MGITERLRMDLEVPVPRVEWSELTGPPRGEPTAAVRARVVAARALQEARWRECGARCNAEVGSETLTSQGHFRREALCLAQRCAERFRLSPRGYHRLLRVARTSADLRLSEEVLESHVAEAAGFRGTAESNS